MKIPELTGRNTALGISAAACAWLLLTGPAPAGEPEPADAQTTAEARSAADLFARPGIAAPVRTGLTLARGGDIAGAVSVFDRLIAEHGTLGDLHAIRAALAMLTDDPGMALYELKTAAGLDVPDLTDIASDPVFAPLAADPEYGPRLTALLTQHPPVPPREAVAAPAKDGQVAVTALNTVWNPAAERLEAYVVLPDANGIAVLPDRPKAAAQDILRDLYEQGHAAGNHGDLYDNRDRGHSALKPGAHPQLTHITYGEAARRAGVDYGLNEQILFNRPVLGNSSTALVTRPYWRSQPRHAMTNPDGTGPLRLWQNVQANHFYIYPAHKDFTDDNGDLFPANTPYILVSRGSSGSDRPFLEAVAMILAAFRPDTKARLLEEQLLVSTVQMVFRRSLQNVRSREAYFSGDAHPAVFLGQHINLARMVRLANSITPDAIPTEVRLRVETEEPGAEGVDFFGQGLSEQLFDTPQAIARIWRSKTARRSMVLSAGDSRDANDRELTFHWHLLQGDPDKVLIEPLGDGSRARITLDWHEPFPLSEEDPLLTSRVDIGVFAYNGMHDSAPAILSWYFPPHEDRAYGEGPDGAMRIVSLDHTGADSQEVYTDPLLFPVTDWRDDYSYDAGGRLLGWTRYREGRTDAYDARGVRILTRDAQNRPLSTDPVAYTLQSGPGGRLVVEEISARQGIPHFSPAR